VLLQEPHCLARALTPRISAYECEPGTETSSARRTWLLSARIDTDDPNAIHLSDEWNLRIQYFNTKDGFRGSQVAIGNGADELLHSVGVAANPDIASWRHS
jgi:hypothetical protein